MTQFLYGALAGALPGGFIGFIAASLVYASKASALADQREEDEQAGSVITRAARLSN